MSNIASGFSSVLTSSPLTRNGRARSLSPSTSSRGRELETASLKKSETLASQASSSPTAGAKVKSGISPESSPKTENLKGKVLQTPKSDEEKHGKAATLDIQSGTRSQARPETIFSTRNQVGTAAVSTAESPLENPEAKKMRSFWPQLRSPKSLNVSPVQNHQEVNDVAHTQKIRDAIQKLNDLSQHEFRYSLENDPNIKVSKEAFINQLLEVIKSLQSLGSTHTKSLNKAVLRLGLKAMVLLVGNKSFYSSDEFSKFKKLPDEVTKEIELGSLFIEMNEKMDSLLTQCFKLKDGYLVNKHLNKPEDLEMFKNQFSEMIAKEPSADEILTFTDSIFRKLEPLTRPLPETVTPSSPLLVDITDHNQRKRSIQDSDGEIAISRSETLEGLEANLQAVLTTAEKIKEEVEKIKKEGKELCGKVNQVEENSSLGLQKINRSIDQIQEKQTSIETQFEHLRAELDSTTGLQGHQNRSLEDQKGEIKGFKEHFESQTLEMVSLKKEVDSLKRAVETQERFITELKSLTERLQEELKESVTKASTTAQVAAAPSPAAQVKSEGEIESSASQVKPEEGIANSETQAAAPSPAAAATEAQVAANTVTASPESQAAQAAADTEASVTASPEAAAPSPAAAATEASVTASPAAAATEAQVAAAFPEIPVRNESIQIEIENSAEAEKSGSPAEQEANSKERPASPTNSTAEKPASPATSRPASPAAQAAADTVTASPAAQVKPEEGIANSETQAAASRPASPAAQAAADTVTASPESQAAAPEAQVAAASRPASPAAQAATSEERTERETPAEARPLTLAAAASPSAPVKSEGETTWVKVKELAAQFLGASPQPTAESVESSSAASTVKTLAAQFGETSPKDGATSKVSQTMAKLGLNKTTKLSAHAMTSAAQQKDRAAGKQDGSLQTQSKNSGGKKATSKP